jgi:signal transduction histidine kinase/ActR/RegA family two-component response regulator
MTDNTSDFENESLTEENKRLRIENKKLHRQLNLTNDNMMKYRSVTSAKENLSAVISAEKLRQDKQLQIIMDNNPDIIFLLDSSFNFLLSTKSFLTLTGIPTIGLLNRQNFRQVFSSFSDETWLGRMETIFRSTLESNIIHTSDEKLYFGADREVRDYALNVIPFVYSGYETNGLFVSFYDLAERKEMEKKLIVALGEATAASKAKGDFLSNMSHEMRTPMNTIIGMTTIGKRADDIDEKDHVLDKIGDAASHLLGIINDVLDMAKIEADKLELVPVDYNFKDMLQKVKSVINYRLEEKRQNLTISVEDEVPRYIIGDDQRIAQVITNLLSNAIKFTPEDGSIRLKVALSGETGDACELRVEVKDSGIGIAPEQQEKIFNAFEQAESGTSREYGGTGLGLVISKRIVELMDGKIWVESELGQGSRFYFTCKVRRGVECAEADKNSSNERSAAGTDDFSDKKLLLAEDIEINREILIALLEDTGIQIDIAENGLIALEIITADPEKYDIMFMDMQMPKMDGLETTRRIRALPALQNSKLPIIAMTANVFQDDINACIAAGMNDHIGKPINIDSVLEKLRKYLNQVTSI